jgi:nitrite reductase/ring-hydroxylating ferredoxin subunit
MVSEAGMTGASGRELVDVASLADLVPGKLKLVRAGTARLALCIVDGDVRAVSAQCTHAKIFLAPGKLAEDGLIECPAHGAKFSPIDGSVKCAPATEPLAVHEVRVVDGHIFVDPGPEATETAAAVTKPGARPSAAQWGNWQ